MVLCKPPLFSSLAQAEQYESWQANYSVMHWVMVIQCMSLLKQHYVNNCYSLQSNGG